MLRALDRLRRATLAGHPMTVHIVAVLALALALWLFIADYRDKD